MPKHKRVLVAGAGLTGCTAARTLVDNGVDVEIWSGGELGGMCMDSWENGRYTQCGGPHWFHSGESGPWAWLRRFGEMQHKLHFVGTEIDGMVVPLPFNRRSQELLGSYTADEVIDAAFRPYSKKMWGREWEDLPAAITERVPKIRDGYDQRYFEEGWQGVPRKSWFSIFEEMVRGIPRFHKRVTWEAADAWPGPIIFTGHLDEFMENRLGPLEYRGMRIEHTDNPPRPARGFHTLKLPSLEQDALSISDTSEFCGDAEHGRGRYVVLYPSREGRFYPYPGREARVRYTQYVEMLPANVFPAGRCGRYEYLDMDDSIRDGWRVAQEVLSSI